MDISKIINQIDELSLFNIYRIHAIVGKMVDDPDKLKPAKNALTVGQSVSIFDAYDNETVQGTVVSVLKTYVRVKRDDDGKTWKYPISWVNLSEEDLKMNTNPTDKVTRTNLNVGEYVSFRNNNEDLYGQVTKINPKRAVVKLTSGESWTVSYSCLTRVIEGSKSIPTIALPPGDVLDITTIH